MQHVWVVEHYNAGRRAIAFELLWTVDGWMAGDVVDGSAWIVSLLIGRRRFPTGETESSFHDSYGVSDT